MSRFRCSEVFGAGEWADEEAAAAVIGGAGRCSLIAPFLVVRTPGSPGNTAVQNHIIATFRALSWHIEEDAFTAQTPQGEKPFRNIIVTKNPDAHRKLVLAAHFDSKYFADFEFLGATDSAAPCGILVDIARSLDPLLEKQTEAALLEGDASASTTLQLIFFDGEEAYGLWSATDSLYGSRHLAEKWAATYTAPTAPGAPPRSVLSQIDALVLLDLLGAPGTTLFNTQRDTSWMWERIVAIQFRIVKHELASSALRATFSGRGPIGYFQEAALTYYEIEDDHKPFLERGVPIVHAIGNPFPKVWHTARDNADAISAETVRDLAVIFRVFVAEYLGLMLY
ncbi:hypothetical protein BDK51DRAFT_35965 [Blyttiomyces helicus]|uniref:Peptide hydrolase n=1 Tax=Blyttiomyces helicus TaxID=388810 RepID=A0A4P9WFK1_9FUNG|nr:hypothetical protein BDK51DRAFT_35965 [Blyttiomyces helicus]|eukprot:RKO90088.1 hypothetical protein BDK51DRAFT_35965 [Blyttiomyces helicus]